MDWHSGSKQSSACSLHVVVIFCYLHIRGVAVIIFLVIQCHCVDGKHVKVLCMSVTLLVVHRYCAIRGFIMLCIIHFLLYFSLITGS